MLHAGFWEGLKDYYENEYNGVMAGKLAIEFAQEINDGGGSFLNLDRSFDPDEVAAWIEDTLEDSDHEIFPNIEDYVGYEDQIASYFMWQDLDMFKSKVKSNHQEFIDEAIRLNWEEMIEAIPDVKSTFVF